MDFQWEQWEALSRRFCVSLKYTKLRASACYVSLKFSFNTHWFEVSVWYPVNWSERLVTSEMKWAFGTQWIEASAWYQVKWSEHLVPSEMKRTFSTLWFEAKVWYLATWSKILVPCEMKQTLSTQWNEANVWYPLKWSERLAPCDLKRKFGTLRLEAKIWFPVKWSERLVLSDFNRNFHIVVSFQLWFFYVEGGKHFTLLSIHLHRTPLKHIVCILIVLKCFITPRRYSKNDSYVWKLIMKCKPLRDHGFLVALFFFSLFSMW